MFPGGFRLEFVFASGEMERATRTFKMMVRKWWKERTKIETKTKIHDIGRLDIHESTLAMMTYKAL